jgi:hypothetical protein
MSNLIRKQLVLAYFLILPALGIGFYRWWNVPPAPVLKAQARSYVPQDSNQSTGGFTIELAPNWDQGIFVACQTTSTSWAAPSNLAQCHK